MKDKFSIGKIEIGGDTPVFFIAEIGGNHNGDIGLAKKMIDAANMAGVQAVKFQTFVAEDVLSSKSHYFDEFKKEQLSFGDFKVIVKHTHDKGMIFFSTPFDFKSVEFLASIDVPAYKIASCDINNFPLMRKIAEKAKPILLSTGASTMEEVERAVSYLEEQEVSELVLMQCTALYPAGDENINLKVIPTFKNRFDLPVGFSDHSLGSEIGLAAVALGANVIEKHFTIDRSLPGGDNEISIMPEELKFLVNGSKRVQKALGKKEKYVSPMEKNIQNQIRRSPVAGRHIYPGEILTEENIAIKRSGSVHSPDFFFKLLGMKAKCNIETDEIITIEKVD